MRWAAAKAETIRTRRYPEEDMKKTAKRAKSKSSNDNGQAKG